MNGLALCAGIGGLELGLKLALGGGYRCVGYVEREAFAASVLVARMEDAALDRAPIWDDLATFNGRPWRGRVDLVSAGYPCQPFSVAGNRGGESDPRHLWPHVRRIIEEAAPSLVFLENVPGHLSLGFDTVLGDLAALGFDAEWCVLGADDVGASHRRKRLWCLAYRELEGVGRGGVFDGEWTARGHDADGCGGARLEHATRVDGGEGWQPDAEAAARRSRGAGESVGDAEGGGAITAEQRGRLRSAVASSGDLGNPALIAGDDEPASPDASGREVADRGSSLWPPPPNDLRAWRGVQTDAQPSLCRVAHGLPDRVDRLRALGNGVVPLAAAHAFRTLAARACEWRQIVSAA